MSDRRGAGRRWLGRLASPLGIVVALTTGLTLAIAFDVSPYLRGPDAWRWAYAIPGAPWRHVVPLSVVAVYVTLMLGLLQRDATRPPSSRATVVILAVAALGVPLIQAALLVPDAPDILRPLFYRTISPGASGVFTVGSQVQALGPFLRQYPALLPTFPVHPQRYPPGLAVLFVLVRRLFEQAPRLADAVGWALRHYQCDNLALMALPNATIATAVLQMALPAITGLVVLPLYGLARAVVGPRAGLWAVALYPLVPSFALWSARWDQAYPLLTVPAWYLFWVGLRRRRAIALVGAGLVVSAATFLSFGLLVMLMQLGLTGLIYALIHRDRWRFLALGAGLFALALVLPWALYRLLAGNGFVDIWRVAMGYHLGLNRDDWLWRVYHLYDFGIFLGIPIAVLLLVGIVRALRVLRGSVVPDPIGPGAPAAQSCSAETSQDEPGHPVQTRLAQRLSARLGSLNAGTFTLAYGAGLLILDLSGVARGEVARVWIFLTPFAVVVAAWTLVRWPAGHRRTVLILLACQLLVFNAVLRVVTTGVVDPPVRTRSFELPGSIEPVDATFADGGAEVVALRGYTLEPETPEAGRPLTVTLYWQALDRISASYTVFNHLRTPAPTATLLSQHDGLPQGRLAPTTCWFPGEVVTDRHPLEIPIDTAPGTYELVTGLYRYDTGERLEARGPAALPEHAVKLTDIVLPATGR